MQDTCGRYKQSACRTDAFCRQKDVRSLRLEIGEFGVWNCEEGRSNI